MADTNLKKRNRALGLALLAFILLVFGVTIAKMHYVGVGTVETRTE